MHQFAADSEHEEADLDLAIVGINRLRALASLLAAEDAASVFAGLTIGEQVAIFGTFEAGLEEAGAAVVRAAQRS